MAEIRGDALEWAIALSKAPAERVALRQRPLPSGIETVLQLATGISGKAVADATERTGESEADILEAARFYVREILFYQGADAYRVLGLPEDASADAIRSHHRLLQQWLHPDRHTSDWDAIFASRVNAAWNELRSTTRRAQYDAQPREHIRDERGGPSWSSTARLPSTAEVPRVQDSDRWRRRAPVIALFGICGMLGILAMRDMQREPAGRLSGPDPVSALASEIEEPLTLHVPENPAHGAAKPVPNPVSQRSRASTPAPARSAVVVGTKARSRPLPTPVAKVVPKSNTIVAISRPTPETLPLPVAKSAPKTTAIAAVSRPAQKPLAPPVSKPIPKPMPKPVAVAAVAKPVAKPLPAPIAKPVPKSSPEQAAIATVSTSAAKSVEVAKAVPAVKLPVAVAETPAAAARAAPAPASASSQQIVQAQQTGKQLMAFVTSRSKVMPPIWDNPNVQLQAVQARSALQETGRTPVGEPHWRIGGGAAAMSAELNTGDVRRRLKVDLVWREQRWLVSHVNLEKAP